MKVKLKKFVNDEWVKLEFSDDSAGDKAFNYLINAISPEIEVEEEFVRFM